MVDKGSGKRSSLRNEKINYINSAPVGSNLIKITIIIFN